MNETAKLATRDVENPLFFKAMYTILRAVFPALKLKLLCHCNTNRPTMDKIFFLAHRTTVVLQPSVNILNNDDLFGKVEYADENLYLQAKEIFGDEDDVSVDSEDDEDQTPNTMDELGDKCLTFREHRKTKLEHDFAVCAWSLSVLK